MQTNVKDYPTLNKDTNKGKEHRFDDILHFTVTVSTFNNERNSYHKVIVKWSI